MRDCPNKGKAPTKTFNDNKDHGRQGRISNLSDARASNAVVSGILSIRAQPFQVLIDPGSTHSFVSLSFLIAFLIFLNP